MSLQQAGQSGFNDRREKLQFKKFGKKFGMKMINGILRFLYLFFKLRPVRHRVTMISRQADQPGIDYKLLSEALHRQDETLEIRMYCRKLGKGFLAKLYALPELFRQMAAIAGSEFVVVDGYNVVVSVLHHRKSLQVFQIWHASAAIKKFGLQTVGKPGGTDPTTAKCMHMHENYDFIACSSRITERYYREAFGYSSDAFVPLALPRVDYIRHDAGARRKELIRRYPVLASGRKNVCYVPTFRKGQKVDLASLARVLDGSRYSLIIRKHPLDRRSEISMSDTEDPLRCPVIQIETESTYDVFSVSDIIVTDYSALAVEASLLEIPLYFYTYDIEEYRRNVGLNVNYSEEPVARYEFHDAESLVRAFDDPYDFEALKAFRDRYFEVPVTGCADRMADFILKEIQEEKTRTVMDSMSSVADHMSVI